MGEGGRIERSSRWGAPSYRRRWRAASSVPASSLDGPTALEELDDRHDERDEQNEVEQASERVRGRETKSPENQQRND